MRACSGFLSLLAASLFVVPAAGVVMAWVPQAAAAEALAGPEPTAGPTGLPDGRLYEQVTPAYKNGNHTNVFGAAAADGDAFLFQLSGPFGEQSSAGEEADDVSRRTPAAGWQAASTMPQATDKGRLGTGGELPVQIVPSADFKRFLFTSMMPFVAGEPLVENSKTESGVNIFLSSDPFAQPQWLGRPRVAGPLPSPGHVFELAMYAVAGASPSLDTVYFAYAGTLVPEDAPRAPYVEIENKLGEFEAWEETGPASRRDNPGGFYEWHEGELVSAGVLPDGSIDPFGAMPAAFANIGAENTPGIWWRYWFKSGFEPIRFDNGVSEDGTEAYFVSPDPEASTVSNPLVCEAAPPCSSRPPELYLRKPGADGQKVSVLVSASRLPGHEGEPAADGLTAVKPPWIGATQNSTKPDFGTYINGSADGSHVFFTTTDRLTAEAPEDEKVKEYDYDVANGSLSYVPIVGPIVAVSGDGGEALFDEENRLRLWRSGGGVTDVAENAASTKGEGPNVAEAHISADGSVVVFRANGEIPGFNNAGGYNQIYRYEVPTATLTCLSCPPQGTPPSGSARIGYQEGETYQEANPNKGRTIRESRGMSADGSRVFFDTPEALVPQDANGVRDVYEWENGKLYLISSGASPERSLYYDSDERGENVFFQTNEALVPGDTDGENDIYDARIPRPGDSGQPQVPCKGAVCQGPPGVPNLLGQPASEAFSGLGNVASAPAAKQRRKRLTHSSPRACKRRYPHNRRRRRACMRRARRGHGAQTAGGYHHAKTDRHHKGRGK